MVCKYSNTNQETDLPQAGLFAARIAPKPLAFNRPLVGLTQQFDYPLFMKKGQSQRASVCCATCSLSAGNDVIVHPCRSPLQDSHPPMLDLHFTQDIPLPFVLV